jgi:hypothetical protein
MSSLPQIDNAHWGCAGSLRSPSAERIRTATAHHPLRFGLHDCAGKLVSPGQAWQP